MHDVRLIRDDPDGFERAMARRSAAFARSEFLDREARRRASITELQGLQERRKAIAREIGAGRKSGRDTAGLESEAIALKERIDRAEAEIVELDAWLRVPLVELPNLADPDVPDGADEAANVVLREHGDRPAFDFAPRQHFELGEALGLMSFEDAARMSGARFVVLRGALARLERALGQFMLDLHVGEHGHTEMSVPLLVNEAAMFGTGQLPKFADEAFRTTDGRWLVPTAEVSLTNLVRDRILPEAELPLRYCALTPCFRSEAGSAGRDTRGMLRQHQFSKCELVSVTAPDASADELERMTRAAETVLERLGLPYRRMLLCAGDMGFSAARTHDLEVWLPGQGAYREISSCSNIRDFQARRMGARYRPRGDASPAFVHTLNGSGVAVGRALVAVMENFQRADGSIAVPEPLVGPMGGTRMIGAGAR